MGLRKSLGYSPIGGPASDVSEFDFVADSKPDGATEENTIFKEAGNTYGLSLAESFAEKMISKAREKVEEKPEKKVASYYLEVKTIELLKEAANKMGVSYSSLVESALKAQLL